MAKTKISEYSSTANSNTDIASINIDEGCAPSGINNAIRALMAQLKDFQQGTQSDVFKGPLQVGAASSIEVTDNTNAALRITQLGTGNALLVEDASNPDSTPFVIDNLGSVINGYTTPLAIGSFTPRYQQHGNSANFRALSVTSWQAGTDVGAEIILARGDNTIIGDYTLVGSSDVLGNLRFYGADGTQMVEAAKISAAVDGTPGTNDMPGRLVFSTTADGASSPTERVRIDSSGNLLVGMTSGTYKVDVTDNSTGTQMRLSSSSSNGCSMNFTSTSTNGRVYRIGSNFSSGAGEFAIFDATAAAERMRIDSSGNVGIGTSSPAGKVDIASTSTTQPVFRALNNGANWAQMLCGYNGTSTNYYDADTQIFRNGATQTERMRIDSSGNLLVGKTTSGNTVVGFEVNPTGAVFSTIASSTNSNSTSHVYSSTAGAYRFYVGMGGTVYATSTSITAISDESLKENIRGLETGLSEILSLKPRRFDWKENTGIDQKNVAGFIAQEFEKVFPDLVYEYQYNETETKKSIKMGDILPTIVKAIQEQQAIINAQQATLTTLTARIEALENK